MPQVRNLLALENQAKSGDAAKLIEHLGDTDAGSRALAAEILLTRQCGPAAACRLQSLEKLASVAGDAGRSAENRAWAVRAIAHSVVTGFPAGKDIDKAAITALARLAADATPAVRSEAVVSMHGLLLGGGEARLAVDLPKPEMDRLLQQLNKDGESKVPFAPQARDVANLLAKQQ